MGAEEGANTGTAVAEASAGEGIDSGEGYGEYGLHSAGSTGAETRAGIQGPPVAGAEEGANTGAAVAATASAGEGIDSGGGNTGLNKTNSTFYATSLVSNMKRALRRYFFTSSIYCLLMARCIQVVRFFHPFFFSPSAPFSTF